MPRGSALAGCPTGSGRRRSIRPLASIRPCWNTWSCRTSHSLAICPLWSSWPSGVSLLVGLLTVLSGIGGALWQCNIALGSYAVPGEWGWQWPLLIAPHLVFAFSHAGRSVGVDLSCTTGLPRTPQAKQALGGFYTTGY